MIRKVALLAAAGSLALAGCGAGVNAGSTEPTQLTEGVNVSQGGIDALNVFVLGPVPGKTLPPGSDLVVHGSLINNGSQTADALTSVSGAPFATAGVMSEGPVKLPPHQLVPLAGIKPLVLLKGVAAPVMGGEHVKLTLTFQSAGAITVNVPVVPAQGPYATLSPAPTPTPSPVEPTIRPTGGSTATAATTTGGPTASPTKKVKKVKKNT